MFITSDTFKTKANKAVPTNFKAKGGQLGITFGKVVKWWIILSLVSMTIRKVILPFISTL